MPFSEEKLRLNGIVGTESPAIYLCFQNVPKLDKVDPCLPR